MKEAQHPTGHGPKNFEFADCQAPTALLQPLPHVASHKYEVWLKSNFGYLEHFSAQPVFGSCLNKAGAIARNFDTCCIYNLRQRELIQKALT